MKDRNNNTLDADFAGMAPIFSFQSSYFSSF